MIDWEATKQHYGFACQADLSGKRPKVVCRCDDCGAKERHIAIRSRRKLNNGQLCWVCYSCASKRRSKQISSQMTALWATTQYRRLQTNCRHKQYRQNLSAKIKQKWLDPSYRKQLETGTDHAGFVSRFNARHGDKFDFSQCRFSDWKTPLRVRCRKCGHISTKYPQKILNGHCATCDTPKNQREIIEFLHQFGEVLVDDTTIGVELDVYLPKQRLAVEHHGLFWHSYGHGEKEDRSRHQRKAIVAQENNIRLIQIFDFEWNKKGTIIRSMLNHALGASEPINARDLQIQRINNTNAKRFFDENHLQGHRTAAITIAGLHNAKILIALSLTKLANGYEIIRFASRIGTCVRGGLSKLLAHLGPSYRPLYTFADLRFSTGDAYRRTGFKFLSLTKPNYFYYRNKIMLSRRRCQKHKLQRLLGDRFDPELSESQNMFKNEFRRVWDAGHIKLVLL